MQKLSDYVPDQFGNVVPFPSIAVFNAGTQTPATIYSDNGVNPIVGGAFTGDQYGRYAFYGSGRFDVVISSAKIVTYTLPDIVLQDSAPAITAVSAALAASSGSSLVGFIQSGTGAVARTLQAVNGAIVRSGDFNTTPNFNTARNALTETIAVNALQVGTSLATKIISLPAITSGRGPSGVYSGEIDFAGTKDPIFIAGYNSVIDPSYVAGEPGAYLAIEGNYNDGSGQNKMEGYWQINGLIGQGAATLRPYSWQANRATAAVFIQTNGTNHTFASADSITVFSVLDSSGFSFTPDNTRDVGLASTRARTGRFGTSVISPIFDSGGAGQIDFMTNLGTLQMRIVHVPSAVNYLQLNSGAAGNAVNIGPQGADSNIDFTIYSQGTGSIKFLSVSATEQFRITHTGSAVNILQVTGGAAGANASIKASAENLLFGSGSALATTATAGYCMFPSCAGTPTGVPTGQAAGKIAMIYDTTANKIWFYNGVWRGVLVA